MNNILNKILKDIYGIPILHFQKERLQNDTQEMRASGVAVPVRACSQARVFETNKFNYTN